MTDPKKNISDVRAALFKVLEGLTDAEKPMDLDRARAVNETAQTIINSAKVEVDYLRVTGQSNAGFLEEPPQITSDQSTSGVPKQGSVEHFPGGIRHRLRG
jgi:hypothetical protein